LSNYRKRRSYPGNYSKPKGRKSSGKQLIKIIAIGLAAIACISLASSLFSRSSDVSKPPNSVVEPTDATSATQPLAEITFSFDGMEFRALEGMTWEEFCVSSYNTMSLVCNVTSCEFNGRNINGPDGVQVSRTDVIVNGCDYELGTMETNW